MKDIYDDNSINIQSEVFNKDFDEVAWEPEVIDDSNEEAARQFGY